MERAGTILPFRITVSPAVYFAYPDSYGSVRDSFQQNGDLPCLALRSEDSQEPTTATLSTLMLLHT